MFVQDLTPLGSLGLSALVAVLPLATVLVLLGAVRMRAHHAALIGLLVALVVGIAAFGMPVVQAVSGALQGAAFGLWPIMWIVVNALWIYRLTVRTGHFDVLRRSFGRISDDPRIQALIIAFCFGALMEALAGFGAPVAISAVMLVAVGFHPVKAAVVALVANTAPVAFGAMGTPVVTLAQVTGLPLQEVSSIVGRQTPLLALVVPLLLVIIVDGKRGLKDTWLPALVCGVAFGLVQFLASNYVSPQLADIGAALAGAAALVALPQTRRPVPEAVRIGTGPGATAEAPPEDSRGDVVKAYLPYLLIIVIFSIAVLPPVKRLLDKATWKFHWPGLNVAAPNGKPVSGNTFSLPFLNTGGTLVLLAGVITAALLAVRAGDTAQEWLATVKELRFAILTVTGVLALAYVMNLSGQTSTIGTFIAAAGAGLAFLSPLLGWFGVAVSGSDTSANALFGALQVTAAHQTGLPADLLAAANSSGGVLGKMVSPQNLTIACVAANLPGEEGKLLRKVLPWSVGLLLVMCLIVWGQSTAVLSWMLP
ncbi:lactate transporter LctP family [Amycolatopsis mediterranei S699]|uniref:L-lactate permease n=2 Tax=Amycolatopsis mediterranei TaxID=33910 RepID=A0A0H3D0Q8_AMYMU|nr:L-lactate permease [Amycolatopsis mediterranei]ADJ43915.1 lactate transporter, LctP family [Amycolatopsis mediterranei U32]AEK40634.1 lactate transporter LctP family protein [Amycolatopsis mediterranei S699]AFO75627.1 lactate transporter LctP family [Amycolatopsis mediterranei S699]AGT82756.1 lactate transporter LctP family [Amycolatopsis mediterranei RB]KDO04292.1 lactate transporter [Amycolatopsis mediterranei]